MLKTNLTTTKNAYIALITRVYKEDEEEEEEESFVNIFISDVLLVNYFRFVFAERNLDPSPFPLPSD